MPTCGIRMVQLSDEVIIVYNGTDCPQTRPPCNRHSSHFNHSQHRLLFLSMDTYQFSQVYPATAVWPSPGSTFVATADADSVSIRLTSSLEQVRSWVCEAGDFSSRWCIDTLQWSPSGARILAHSSKLASAWVFDLTGDEANCRLRGVDKVEWGGEDVVSWSDRVGPKSMSRVLIPGNVST
jgi:hypothetical protein